MSAVLTVFVYFRAAPPERAAVEDALARHFARVESACGLRGRAGLRRDRDKPWLTWLETWDGVAPERLESALAAIDASARASGLEALAPEGRHREVFEAALSEDRTVAATPRDRPAPGSGRVRAR